MDIKEVIRATARQEGVTEAEVRREIQKAIDQAWRTPKPMQKKLFPEGKPDVETFLLRIRSVQLH